MKKFVFAVAVLMGLSSPSFAADLNIEDAWARASAGPARAGAAFLTIMNMGEEDKLLSAKADVSKRVELHTHLHENGVMKMREVKHVPAPKGKTMLKPGSYHVMFMGLNAPFKEGQMFPLTLVFEKAGEVKVHVKVQKAGSMGKGHSQMKHDMKEMKH